MLYNPKPLRTVLAGSSNGRTWAFEAQYLGSNPSPAVLGKSEEYLGSLARPKLQRRRESKSRSQEIDKIEI